MVINAGGKVKKGLINAFSPVPRRLVKPIQVARSGKGMDGTSGETVQRGRIISESREVIPPTYSVNRISRRKTRHCTGSRNGTPTSCDPISRVSNLSPRPKTDACDRFLGLLHMQPFQLDIFTHRKERWGMDCSDRPISKALE